MKPYVMAYNFSPSTWEAELGGSIQQELPTSQMETKHELINFKMHLLRLLDYDSDFLRYVQERMFNDYNLDKVSKTKICQSFLLVTLLLVFFCCFLFFCFVLFCFV